MAAIHSKASKIINSALGASTGVMLADDDGPCDDGTGGSI